MEDKGESIGRRFARGVRRRARSAWARLGRGALKGTGFDAELRRLVGPSPWCVDSVAIVDGRLMMAGWAIAVDGDPDGIDIRVNGIQPDDLERRLHRPDVAFYYWFLPEANRSGFRCAHRLTQAPAAHWTIENVNRVTGRAIEPWHNFYVRASDLRESGPVPSLSQICRVHGGNSQNQYLIEGYSTYVKIDLALRAVTGRPVAAFRTILDFGCGCGRLARYFPYGCRLVGTDIDRENVEWCRANLPGEFLVNSRMPPLDLASSQFDCVVANDVFTHLPEADGSAWLREIARVCRTGAIVVISIAWERALTRARLTADRYAEIRALDFIDLSRNTDLDGVIEDRMSYRNVFHSHVYIRARWPEVGFEILDIIPGVSGNQQDLVVMRKR